MVIVRILDLYKSIASRIIKKYKVAEQMEAIKNWTSTKGLKNR